MRAIRPALFVLLFCDLSAAADWGFPGEIFENSYLSTVTQKMVDASPGWQATAENPPLSARKAIQKADDLLKAKFDFSKYRDFEMRIRDAALTPLGHDKWIWLINYEGRTTMNSTGMPPFLEVVVLMDGQVVMPEKRPR